MRAGHVVYLACNLQQFAAEFADCLQHPVAGRAFIVCFGNYEGVLDQPVQYVERSFSTKVYICPEGLRRCRIPASHEYGEAPEQCLFRWSKKLVAPGNRVLHGSLALGQIPGATCEHGERLIQSGKELRGAQYS